MMKVESQHQIESLEAQLSEAMGYGGELTIKPRSVFLIFAHR
jgi:hypothetical protein